MVWASGLRKRRLFWIGPLFGGCAGLFWGPAGLLIGLPMGYLLQELIRQLYTDKAVLRYFENPGHSAFYEGEPGLAAYCALGIYIMFQSKYKDEGLITDRVVRNAASVFPRGDRALPLIELFCRLAVSRRMYLNPDLLAESLMARRKSRGDLPLLGERLEGLALGDDSRREAAYIRSLFDPRYDLGDRFDRPRETFPDPWQILGLAPGVSRDKVKAAFRRLAIRCHPDMLQTLDEKTRKEAAAAFMTIKDAYREIMRAPREESRETRFS
jgi:DnaJ like chaperone protein